MDNLKEKEYLDKLYKLKKNNMENKLVLNTTELTGILRKREMKKLSLEIGENNWKTYREKIRFSFKFKNL